MNSYIGTPSKSLVARFHAINDAYIAEVGDRSGRGLQIAAKMDCLVWDWMSHSLSISHRPPPATRHPISFRWFQRVAIET